MNIHHPHWASRITVDLHGYLSFDQDNNIHVITKILFTDIFNNKANITVKIEKKCLAFQLMNYL